MTQQARSNRVRRGRIAVALLVLASAAWATASLVAERDEAAPQMNQFGYPHHGAHVEVRSIGELFAHRR